MNLALVDDVESDLQMLRSLLTEYCSEQHVNLSLSLFLSGEQFLADYRPGRFDAVFLDNLMEGLSGMDTARRLRKTDAAIPVIFITTEKSYALEGYTVQALDYILKPVTMERLGMLMNRLITQQMARHVLEIKENRMTRHVYLDDVLYVRSTGHFLEIQTTLGIIKPYMTLEYFLSMLRELGEYGESALGLRFQNCCRGYVVCLDHVTSFNSSEFTMADGNSVPISRPKYKEMKEAYASYLFRKTRNGAD